MKNVTVAHIEKIIARSSPHFVLGRWITPEMALLHAVLVQWFSDIVKAYKTDFKNYDLLLRELPNLEPIVLTLGLKREFLSNILEAIDMPSKVNTHRVNFKEPT